MVKHDDDLPSLEQLQQRIDAVKGTPNEGGKSALPRGSDLSQAMRFSIDLAAGVAVGVGFGYFLDKWLGTIPLFMIAGLFLGVVAGFRNMLRTAESIENKIETDEKNDE